MIPYSNNIICAVTFTELPIFRQDRNMYSRRHRGYSIQSRLSVCPRTKTKTAWAIDTKCCKSILYSSRLPCIDPEVKRSKGKVTQFRKPSRSHGCYWRVVLRIHLQSLGVKRRWCSFLPNYFGCLLKY